MKQGKRAYLSLVLLHINLVPQHDEREVLGVMRAGLDKELVAPAVEGLERFRAVHVIHEHATVCATVEGDTERLETLLACGVP